MSEAATIDAPAPASSGFLETPTEQAAVVPAPNPNGALNPFFDATYKDGDNFKEGWTQHLEKAGYPRLANKGALSKTEGDFLKSLEHMAQFVGKKTGHLPPTAESTPAEIAEYRKQIGAPEDPKEYAFKPEKLPEGMDWDEAKGAEFEALMHSENIPKAFGPKAAAFYAQVMEDTAVKAHAHTQVMLDTSIRDSEAHFRQKWGADYEATKKQCGDYAKALGFNLDDPITKQALARKEFVELLDQSRRELRGKLPGGSEMTSSTSPRQEARQLMNDNPNWSNDPALHGRITKLMELEALRNA